MVPLRCGHDRTAHHARGAPARRQRGTRPEPLVLTKAGELGPGAKKENSGLVQSRTTPGLFWALNDSGDEPRIYPVRADGSLIVSQREPQTRACWSRRGQLRLGGHRRRRLRPHHHRRLRQQLQRPARPHALHGAGARSDRGEDAALPHHPIPLPGPEALPRAARRLQLRRRSTLHHRRRHLRAHQAPVRHAHEAVPPR